MNRTQFVTLATKTLDPKVTEFVHAQMAAGSLFDTAARLAIQEIGSLIPIPILQTEAVSFLNALLGDVETKLGGSAS